MDVLQIRLEHFLLLAGDPLDRGQVECRTCPVIDLVEQRFLSLGLRLRR